MVPATNIGASQTDWSIFGRLAADDDEVAAQALERLARRYWPAIYAYCRTLGHSADEASDLTQGFICDVVLARKLLHTATPQRGRFRSLLLRSLQNYLRGRHRSGRRREIGLRHVSSDVMPVDGDLADPSNNRSPDEAFVSQWAVMLVHQALEKLRAQCQEDGLTEHWHVFEARIARPLLFGDEPRDYAGLAEEFDLESPSQAANMAVTVKRRFVALLREETAETMDESHRVEDELAELLKGLQGQ